MNLERAWLARNTGRANNVDGKSGNMETIASGSVDEDDKVAAAVAACDTSEPTVLLGANCKLENGRDREG